VILTRRHILGGIASTAVIALTGIEPATALTRNRSANGWPIITHAPALRVEGTDLSVALAPGPATTILVHCLRRYLYEIDHTVQQHELLGHLRTSPGPAPYESNHLSGTAITVRPGWYPTGTSGGFSRPDELRIRDILADCEGVVRWGGDTHPIKESHFQIDVPPTSPRLAGVAARLQGCGMPGLLIDPAAPIRRHTAAALAARQRTH
jgi:hypothetical protein